MSQENDINESSKYIEARNTLPDELKPIYNEVVAAYRYAATLRHGRPYVSYIVLADMVKAGWRLVDISTGDLK